MLFLIGRQEIDSDPHLQCTLYTVAKLIANNDTI